MDINFTPLIESWAFLAQAYLMTGFVSLLSIIVGGVIGVLVGVGRAYGGRFLDVALGFYVDTMRAIPVLVFLVWAYLALPILTGIPLNPIAGSILALGVHHGAYIAEIVRGGLMSVRAGQTRAALALGMSRFQSVKLIVMPQAMIRMLPPLGSILIIAVKDSAIASVIAVPELMRQSQALAGQTFRPLEIYTVALLLYFIILYPLARSIDALYRRVAPLGAS